MTPPESKLFIPEKELSKAEALCSRPSYFLINPLIAQEQLGSPAPRVVYPTLLGAIDAYYGASLKPREVDKEPVTLVKRVIDGEKCVDTVVGEVQIYNYMRLSDVIGLVDPILTCIHYSCLDARLRLTDEVVLCPGHSYDPGNYCWTIVTKFGKETYVEETAGLEKQSIEWSDVKRIIGRHLYVSQELIMSVVYDAFTFAAKEAEVDIDLDDDPACTVLGVKDLIHEVNLAMGYDKFSDMRAALHVAATKLKSFIFEVTGTNKTVLGDLDLESGVAKLYHRPKPEKIIHYH